MLIIPIGIWVILTKIQKNKKQKFPIYLLWITLFFLPILNSKTLNCLFLQKELWNQKALPPSFFKLTCVLTVDNAVRTSHKLSWRSLILLKTLWAHAVKKKKMLPNRECLTQRGTTSSKSSNDGAPLLTSDLSKRIALGEEENIPCMFSSHNAFLENIHFWRDFSTEQASCIFD